MEAWRIDILKRGSGRVSSAGESARIGRFPHFQADGVFGKTGRPCNLSGNGVEKKTLGFAAVTPAATTAGISGLTAFDARTYRGHDGRFPEEHIQLGLATAIWIYAFLRLRFVVRLSLSILYRVCSPEEISKSLASH